MNKKNFCHTFNIIIYFLKDSCKVNYKYWVLALFQVILNALYPIINIFAPLWIVTIISEYKDCKLILLVLGIVITNNCIYNALVKRVIENRNRINDELKRNYDIEICNVSRNIEFSKMENSEFFNDCIQAMKGIEVAKGLQCMSDCIISIISNLIVVLEVIAIVIKSSFILIAIFLLNVLVSLYINNIIRKIEQKTYNENSTANKEFDYISNELTDYKYGMDMRLYNAFDMIMKNMNILEIKISKGEKLSHNKICKLGYLEKITNEGVNGFTYFYLAISVIRKKIKIGEMLTIIEALFTFAQAVKEMVNSVILIEKMTFFLDRYKKFIEDNNITNNDNEIDDNQKQTELNRVKGELEFINVSFKYPNDTKNVLHNISFKINTGDRLALVGINGSGKTTIIKLICRLYNVTDGEILLNGINIEKYDYVEYINNIAVIFQDYKLLSFTLKENIVLDEKNVNTDNLEKIINEIRLEKVVDNLKMGLDAYVYKNYSGNGIDFSKGEAQKIAIARALYKNPNIMIMDEPTAAFDPIAESDMFEMFNELAKGKTTIFVSHRLSSCRFCDLILVLHNGIIIERGSHKKLMELENGMYRYMYNMQIELYT